MSLSNYIRPTDGAVRFAGNYWKLFAAKKADVLGLTSTAGPKKFSAITMAAGKKFNVVEADINGIQFNKSVTSGRARLQEDELIVRMSKSINNITPLKKVVQELDDAVTCGLVFMWIDNAGNAYLAGAGEESFNELEYTENSGEGHEDEDGNVIEMTFRRTAGSEEYFADGAFVTGLLDGTSAAVNWPS